MYIYIYIVYNYLCVLRVCVCKIMYTYANHLGHCPAMQLRKPRIGVEVVQVQA